jgi:hypothetical protein
LGNGLIPLLEEIRFEPLWVENRHGRRLFALLSEPVAGEATRLVVLPPAYERRVHHYSVLSRFLVRNGFSTLRFDVTNHIGLSDGGIVDFTMSSMTADVQDVLRACRDRFEDQTLYLIASSLAARATIRALASDRVLQRWFPAVALVLPVVDVEYSMTRAIGRNFIDARRKGEVIDPTAVAKALGREVPHRIARDAIANGFEDAERTRRELAELECRVTAIAAEWDDWVDYATVAKVMAGEQAGPRQMVVLDANSHDVERRPDLVRRLMEQVLAALGGSRTATGEICHLELDEIVETVNAEKEWRRESYRSLGLSAARDSAP